MLKTAGVCSIIKYSLKKKKIAEEPHFFSNTRMLTKFFITNRWPNLDKKILPLESSWNHSSHNYKAKTAHPESEHCPGCPWWLVTTECDQKWFRLTPSLIIRLSSDPKGLAERVWADTNHYQWGL